MARESERYRVEPRRQGDPQAHRAPAGRQAPQRKRPLPPEERRRRELAARQAREEAREAARERRLLRKERRKMLFRLSLIAGLIFTALYWCWVAFNIVTRPDGNENALPLMIFTEGERDEDETMEPEEVSFGGKVYLPVSALEPYMAISQFGDYQTRSFLICDSGEYATFYLGTPLAIINGQKVCLKEKVFLKEDTLYLPIDFYTDKMNCFTFAESAPLAANVLTFRSQVDPAMRFHQESDCPPVDVNTIPVAPQAPTA